LSAKESFSDYCLFGYRCDCFGDGKNVKVFFRHKDLCYRGLRGGSMTKRKPKSQRAKQLSLRPETFRRLVGMTPGNFFEICERIRPTYLKAEEKRLCKIQAKTERILGLAIDGQYKLSLEDRVLMLLMYYRLYVTHVFLGFLFGISESNVCRNKCLSEKYL